jgi:hypothetical protein
MPRCSGPVRSRCLRTGCPPSQRSRSRWPGRLGFLSPGASPRNPGPAGTAGKGAPQAVRGVIGGLTQLARGSPGQETSRFSFHADIVRGALVVLKTRVCSHWWAVCEPSHQRLALADAGEPFGQRGESADANGHDGAVPRPAAVRSGGSGRPDQLLIRHLGLTAEISGQFGQRLIHTRPLRLPDRDVPGTARNSYQPIWAGATATARVRASVRTVAGKGPAAREAQLRNGPAT